MKKLLLIATATLVCFGVMAQGKISFQVNSDQLIYFSTDKAKLAPADANKTVGGVSLAGSGLYTGAGGTIASLAGSPSIIAGLWAGTSASTLAKVTTTTFGDVNFSGFITAANVTLDTRFPSGTPAFFQLQVYDSAYGSAAEAWAVLGKYAGESPVFQATPGAVYNPMWVKGSPVNSTLASGTQLLTDYAGFPGYFGLVQVYATIPEPGTFALVGLGLASLLIFRRRR